MQRVQGGEVLRSQVSNGGLEETSQAGVQDPQGVPQVLSGQPGTAKKSHASRRLKIRHVQEAGNVQSSDGGGPAQERRAGTLDHRDTGREDGALLQRMPQERLGARGDGRVDQLSHVRTRVGLRRALGGVSPDEAHEGDMRHPRRVGEHMPVPVQPHRQERGSLHVRADDGGALDPSEEIPERLGLLVQGAGGRRVQPEAPPAAGILPLRDFPPVAGKYHHNGNVSARRETLHEQGGADHPCCGCQHHLRARGGISHLRLGGDYARPPPGQEDECVPRRSRNGSLSPPDPSSGMSRLRDERTGAIAMLPADDLPRVSCKRALRDAGFHRSFQHWHVRGVHGKLEGKSECHAGAQCTLHLHLV
mmetsp:Transcript_19837/g.46564  ORF Transcript_19837/g.46564 Transcript_19837/m.46564 type:complete len:362 (+) Transcript_19837:189-1274(+)